MGGATTFARKSQECLGQDWYIYLLNSYVFFLPPLPEKDFAELAHATVAGLGLKGSHLHSGNVLKFKQISQIQTSNFWTAFNILIRT